jgi:hypothetical protein
MLAAVVAASPRRMCPPRWTHRATLPKHRVELLAGLVAAIDGKTPEDAAGWLAHAGYEPQDL